MPETIQIPSIVLVAEMERGQKQHASGNPAMEDIQALVGDARHEADQVVLTGEEDQERHLGDSKPGSADGEGGVVLRTRHIVVDKFESEDESEVSQEDKNGAERWDFEPEGAPWWSPLGIR